MVAGSHRKEARASPGPSRPWAFFFFASFRFSCDRERTTPVAIRPSSADARPEMEAFLDGFGAVQAAVSRRILQPVNQHTYNINGCGGNKSQIGTGNFGQSLVLTTTQGQGNLRCDLDSNAKVERRAACGAARARRSTGYGHLPTPDLAASRSRLTGEIAKNEKITCAGRAGEPGRSAVSGRRGGGGFRGSEGFWHRILRRFARRQ